MRINTHYSIIPANVNDLNPLMRRDTGKQSGSESRSILFLLSRNSSRPMIDTALRYNNGEKNTAESETSIPKQKVKIKNTSLCASAYISTCLC